jgi:hypothetical protein
VREAVPGDCAAGHGFAFELSAAVDRVPRVGRGGAVTNDREDHP